MKAILLLLALTVTGQSPVSSHTQLMEAIGEQGAAALAAERGLIPILTDADKSLRQGFDQVYRSGKQVIVIEAKGGSSRLGVARGHAQASEAWTLAVARETLKRSSATQAELTAAREVLAAAPRGNLTIEVVRTKMKDGQLRTVVEHVVKTRNEVAIARLAAAVGLALELYTRITRAMAIEVEYGAGRIDVAERDRRHLKNLGGSLGALGTAGTAMVLVGPQGVAVSLLFGGGAYVIGDWAGGQAAVLLADWLHDRDISVSESCAAMAARAASAGAEAWSWVQQSGGAAWSWTAEQGGIAWSWVRDVGTGAWSWTARQGNSAWDWTAESSSSAWGWTSRSADNAWSWTSQTGQGAWRWTTRSGHSILESAQESGLGAWDWARRNGGAAWEWTARKLPGW
ncbi:hypothetical protein AB1L88_09550 [Tautonia sp. JC769]|uniref:hypothetical protein n=1 Tax=Tautonia sp. JC769 TaxID=3232135 RepID=UPI003459B998